MLEPVMTTIDGNVAAAHVAHLTIENVAIHPSAKASSTDERAHEWASLEGRNSRGTVAEGPSRCSARATPRVCAAGRLVVDRYDPRQVAKAENPPRIDSKSPNIPYRDFAYSEHRFGIRQHAHPQISEEHLRDVAEYVDWRFARC
jgi:hypothetical protein